MIGEVAIVFVCSAAEVLVRRIRTWSDDLLEHERRRVCSIHLMSRSRSTADVCDA